MRHRIRHDINPHRIRLVLRELVEIPLALAFTFPAVAEVGVMADDDHHAVLRYIPCAVKDALEVHRLAIAAVARLPGDSLVAAPPRIVDARHLRLFLEAIHALEYLMRNGQLLRLTFPLGK